jgi:hypothetical protein
MKKFLTILSIFVVGLLSAQDSASLNNNVVNDAGSLQRAASANQSSYGQSTYFVNPARPVKGSIYLFDKWENRGVLVTIDKQRYGMKNINIDLKHQSFQSKFSKDSIFNYNFNNIDRFIINNKVYKNFYYNEDNRIYEIVHETPDYSILKGYKVDLVEGSANPMLNRKSDKYVQKHNYFVKTENAIKKFKLGKKQILKLIGANKATGAKIVQYAKDNNLSFKKDFDVKKILDYSKSL